MCYHYNKSGHLMSDCWLLKKRERVTDSENLVGLINSKKSELTVEQPVLPPVEIHVVTKPLERFQGGVFETFISEGSVSPVGVTKTEKPMCVVKDTGSAQTVSLNSVLPLSDGTDLHKSVLVECIGCTGYQSLLLHRVCLKSKYVLM